MKNNYNNESIYNKNSFMWKQIFVEYNKTITITHYKNMIMTYSWKHISWKDQIKENLQLIGKSEIYVKNCKIYCENCKNFI